jgi:hypothetical protein
MLKDVPVYPLKNHPLDSATCPKDGFVCIVDVSAADTVNVDKPARNIKLLCRL